MSITASSFYWCNDTPRFVTWWSRLATTPDTPTCIVIHGGQLTGGVHSPNQFVPEIVSPLPCSPGLVCHTLLIVYFFKELISFIGCLDKCHSSVFNALIKNSEGLLKSQILVTRTFTVSHYTLAKRIFSGLYWNQAVCQSVCVPLHLSVLQILVILCLKLQLQFFCFFIESSLIR